MSGGRGAPKNSAAADQRGARQVGAALLWSCIPVPLLALLFIATSDTKATCTCAQPPSSAEVLANNPTVSSSSLRCSAPLQTLSLSLYRASPAYPRRKVQTHLPRQLDSFSVASPSGRDSTRRTFQSRSSASAGPCLFRPSCGSPRHVRRILAPLQTPTPYPRHLWTSEPAAESVANPQSIQVSRQLRHTHASNNAQGHHPEYRRPVPARGECASPGGRHLRRLGPTEANQHCLHPMPQQVRMPSSVVSSYSPDTWLMPT